MPENDTCENSADVNDGSLLSATGGSTLTEYSLSDLK